MPGLLIIAHAPMASSLKTVAQHAFPDCVAHIATLDVLPEACLEDTEKQARALLAKIRNPDALIFTDVFGATPCNIAQRLADGRHVKVIVGVNVPMLWRSLCYLHEPLDCLLARALLGATQGVMQLDALGPQPHPS
jgi:mannose PTS system EIIA component